LDNIQRSHLTSGHLAHMRDRGVRGLTSNPSIFQKAIQGSVDYDDQFKSLIDSGKSIEDSYWEMVLTDISDALDVFLPLFNSSGGGDGFVSVEVDPRLAHDTDGTLSAARWLRSRIEQPNVMIKIPATLAGLPVIRQMIAEGCNVNVTLIFSIPRYEEVMEAFISGLEDAVAAGATDLSGVSSVASFFISRVDSEIDKQLGIDSSLAGTAAINQGVLAYQTYKRVFSGLRWERLQALGAKTQRPLWASTSTKNPAYPDTLYVDSLIGPDTVNTLPENTLEAFADHGRLARSIDADPELAIRQWTDLAEHGIDVDAVAAKLEDEGVAAFITSFDDLLKTLKDKAVTFSA
jgi:transaldolase